MKQKVNLTIQYGTFRQYISFDIICKAERLVKLNEIVRYATKDSIRKDISFSE